MTSPVYVVLGAGPGLGLSAARRFAERVRRDTGRPDRGADGAAGASPRRGFDAEPDGVDLTDPADVTALIEGRRATRSHRRAPLQPERLARGRRAAPHRRPALRGPRARGRAAAAGGAGGRGACGRGPGAGHREPGSRHAWPEAPSLGIQKAAVRNLVTSLDATLAPDGIRAVAVQINGSLAKEGPSHRPRSRRRCTRRHSDPTAAGPRTWPTTVRDEAPARRRLGRGPALGEVLSADGRASGARRAPVAAGPGHRHLLVVRRSAGDR